MQQTNLELSPAAWFFVSETEADNATSNTVPIQSPFRIGRHPELELCLPCQSVSGLHAEIVEDEKGLWLEDLESTNGTFVNGERINSKHRLSENDTIQFGTTVFHISKAAAQTKSSSNAWTGNVRGKSISESQQDNRLERLFNGGVVPFFQPIVSLESNEQVVVGYEVLGRSHLFGLKTPAQMFAAASRLELEAELSRVLRKQGIKVAAQHLDSELKLFVNTHPAELECSGLEESLFEIRDEHPDCLIQLEFHESILNDPEKILRLRSSLDNLDIKLVLHDVGSGQIRISNLTVVCPDVIKFDSKLLQGIDKMSGRKQRFVASLVNLVKDLGAVPMAQYIEQQGEHQTVSEMGFELGQGFYYGRPSSISDQEVIASTPRVKCFLKDDERDGESWPESSETPRDGNWLLEQPKNHFTIQVLSAISEERAVEHVLSQDDPGEFAIFAKEGKTRMLYIVCYGIFEERSAAKVVAEQLADASISPWIRMLSSIHAEIEK